MPPSRMLWLVTVLSPGVADGFKVHQDMGDVSTVNATTVLNETSKATLEKALQTPAGQRLFLNIAKDPDVVHRAAAAMDFKLTATHEHILHAMKHAPPEYMFAQWFGRALGRSMTKSRQLAKNMKEKLDLDENVDTSDLQAECEGILVNQMMRMITGGELMDWTAIGEELAPAVLNFVAETAVSVIGAINPLAGIVAGLGMSLLTGLLGGQEEEDPMQQLYEQIMNETKELISEANMKAALDEYRAEAAVLLEELDWFPDVLGQTGVGASQNLEDHTAVLWHMMMQQHIALLLGKVWSYQCMVDVYSSDCQAWQRSSGGAVLEIALTLIKVQQQELVEIGRLEPSYKDGMDQRIEKVTDVHYRQASAALPHFMDARAAQAPNKKDIFIQSHTKFRSRISALAETLTVAMGSRNSFQTSSSPVIDFTSLSLPGVPKHLFNAPVHHVISGYFFEYAGDNHHVNPRYGYQDISYMAVDRVRENDGPWTQGVVYHSGNHHQWKICPAGTFLRGMFFSNGGSDSFNNWDRSVCLRLHHTPWQSLDEDLYVRANCYNIDTQGLLAADRPKKWVQCDPGYAIRGILQYGWSDGGSHTLKQFQCCALVPLGARTRQQNPDATNIDELEFHALDYKQAAGYTYLGAGLCSGKSAYNDGWAANEPGKQSLEKCAQQCSQDSSCTYFGFIKGSACARFASNNCWTDPSHNTGGLTWSLYGKINGDAKSFQYAGPGRCSHHSHNLIAHGASTFQACANLCKNNNECKFFSVHTGSLCEIYRNDLCPIDGSDSTNLDTYAAYQKIA